jgi:hypothetical protein
VDRSKDPSRGCQVRRNVGYLQELFVTVGDLAMGLQVLVERIDGGTGPRKDAWPTR